MEVWSCMVFAGINCTATNLHHWFLFIYYSCWQWKCIDVLILKNGLPLPLDAVETISSYMQHPNQASPLPAVYKNLSVNAIGSQCASSAPVLQLFNINDTLNSCSLLYHIFLTVVWCFCPGAQVSVLFCTFGEICFSAFLTFISTLYMWIQ